jgi:rhamnosyltransferase
MDKVSIALLTFNGEKYLSQVLEMIHDQSYQVSEILAIDSGSTDSTLKILQSFQIAAYRIPQSEFSHSRTRNLAAQLCNGRYIVFLTQDATPANRCWLEYLLRPFQDNRNVAGTFSRQVPRPNASLLESNDLSLDFPTERNIKTQNSASPDLWKAIKFSNSSAAYDRRLLLQNPFDERLQMAEDQEWAKRALEQGFTLVYEPESIVFHSHNHSLREKYDRSISMGRSFSSFLKSSLGNRSIPVEIGACIRHILLDFEHITHSKTSIYNKIRWLILSPAHRGMVHYAFCKGWNEAEPTGSRRPVTG